jgi:outer membrane lipoprotein-sorting protein
LNILRTTSTRRLIAGAAVSVAIVAGGVVGAMAASGGGTPPPDKPLAAAIHDSLAAPKPTAITARVHFTNNLISTGALPIGSPLLTGASGRLWFSGDRLRLELQSDTGDAQISVDNGQLTVYDASSNTVYKAQIATKADTATAGTDTTHGVPTIDEITSALSKLAQQATLSGAQPTTQAGEPMYNVSVTPKHDAGLLGQVEVGWDAANGIPLHVSISAAGSSSPVLALDVTDISFGSVDSSALSITAPAGAKVVDLGSLGGNGSGTAGSPGHSVTEGLTAVSAAVPFTLKAPDTLVGLPRTGVRLISDGKDPSALVTYGKGLGAIAVVERAAGTQSKDNPLASLPSVSIDGATGRELPTALGTLVTVERGGVSYTLVGSLPPSAAETALRAVLA